MYKREYKRGAKKYEKSKDVYKKGNEEFKME